MDTANSPCSESCNGIVTALAYGPQNQLSSLLAIGTSDNRLTVKTSSIDEDKVHSVTNIAQAFRHETLINVPLNSPSSRINTLSWSPDSVLGEASAYIRLAIQLGSSKVCLVTNDGQETTVNDLQISHTRSINDIAFNASDERILATVGDDSTVKIWDIEVGVAVSSLRLTSPGMSVRFNSLEQQQMMVAEKNGRIRFYNLSTNQPIRSLETPQTPLLQADWSVVNSSRVGAVAGNNWYCWDANQSSVPLGVGVAHNSPCTGFAWSRSHENLFSTTSQNGQFRIHQCGQKGHRLSHEAQITPDMSWHPSYPVVAMATNRRVFFWGVD